MQGYHDRARSASARMRQILLACSRGLAAVTWTADCLVVSLARPSFRVAPDADVDEPRVLSAHDEPSEFAGHSHIRAEIADITGTLRAREVYFLGARERCYCSCASMTDLASS